MADNSTYNASEWANSTGGMTQEQLAALWNNAGMDNQFMNQGSLSWDQVADYGGDYTAAHRALGNARHVIDGDSNPENDYDIQRNPDGTYGYVPILRHGWNKEFITFAAPIVAAGAAAALGAGGAAAGAGAEGAAGSGAAGAGAYGSSVPTLSAAEIGNPLYGTAEAWAGGAFPAMNVAEGAAGAGAIGAGAGGGGGAAGGASGGAGGGEAAYGWNPEGYTGGTPQLAGGGFGGAGNMGSTSTGFLGMGTNDWLQLGGSLLNGYLGNKAANNALDAQLSATRDSNALLKYMYDQTRTDNMPALQARNAGLAGYQNLLSNPNKITSDPGYQFGLNQGTKAINSQAAAKGGYYSGATLKALDQYGQDYAGTKFDQSLNRYGNLAGLGGTGTQTIAQAGQNYSQGAANNLIGAGNARGAASMAGSNAWQNALNSYLGYQQYKNMFGG